MADPLREARQLIELALAEDVEKLEIDGPDPNQPEAASGALRASGWVRSEEGDPREVLAFIEELASDACGRPVQFRGPVIHPDVTEREAVMVLKAAGERDAVVHIEKVGPKTLRVRARYQPLTLSKKRDRLPKLRQRLTRWTVVAEPLGSCLDPDELTSLPAVQRHLAPFLRAQQQDPSVVHEHKLDRKRMRLTAMIDATELGPAQRSSIEQAFAWATDIDLRLLPRIARHRARALVYEALGALPYLTGHTVLWDTKLGGVLATVEAEQEHKEALDRFFGRWAKKLGVPVQYRFDTGRALMIGRIARDFPEAGILTRVHHLGGDEAGEGAAGTLYEVHADLPLRPYEELEAWTDAMEEKWGIQIVLEEARLFAPDLRYRDQLGADLETIALRYNRPQAFPPEVLEQAQQLADGFSLEEELKRRRDIRDIVVMSIDPVRTRDLDDALSIEDLGDGRYRVGVHIADVSPFVPQDSALDEEALKRSFTTYLSKGEIPVIPEILANGVCSLHGGEDSLALSLFATLDDDATVLDFHIERVVMHNHHRWSYAGAQAVLDGQEHEHAWRLRTLNRLAQQLRTTRKAEGSLDLNLEPDPEKPSHQLIEEFMLMANECVARYLAEKHPLGLCLYRTHPHVTDTDFGPLSNVARYLGCETKVTDQHAMQRALQELADKAMAQPEVGWPRYHVFRFHVGRVLEKATYHVEQLGHGALAKLHYAHFTSPIRRYSDLIVHRLIEDCLYREERGGSASYQPEGLLPVCDHMNKMEIRVDAGSFESHRLAELKRFDRAGKLEQGVVMGLLKGRIQVRLEETDLLVNIPFRDDNSRDQEMPVRITDQNTRISVALGQQVLVRTRGVDWNRKSIDAQLVR